MPKLIELVKEKKFYTYCRGASHIVNSPEFIKKYADIVIQKNDNSYRNTYSIFLNLFSCMIKENYSNCGILEVHFTSYSKELLDFVEEYASISGYNILQYTLVGNENFDYIKKQYKLFLDLGWQCIFKCPSNRHSEYTQFILIKYIENPVTKGY